MPKKKENIEEKYFGIITLIYNGNEYVSLPLDLNVDANTKIIMQLSENGTTELSMLKIPLSESSFIIFSKEQLNVSIVKIDIVEK